MSDVTEDFGTGLRAHLGLDEPELTELDVAIATDGNEDIQHHADDVIYVPKTPNFLQAVLGIIPLQLLAYRIARLRDLNVDQPRNLAKTVTVE